MPATNRNGNTGLIERIAADPTAFSFFQIHRFLKLYTQPHLSRFGQARYLPVKYRTHLSLSFPANEVQDINIPAEVHAQDEDPPPPVEVFVNFLGLVGPSGVLPRHYTEELLLDRQLNRVDHAHQFFDMFNHRLIALFAAAWEKYRFYIPYEQGERKTFTRYLLDLAGMGTTGLFGRLSHDLPADKLPDYQILAYYSGIASQRPRCALNLGQLLGDYFDVPSRVEELVGTRMFIPPEQRTRVGVANSEIASTMVAGFTYWSRQSKCRVVIGPMPLQRYLGLLPGGSAHVALVALVRWFVGPTLAIEVQLILARDEVPEPKFERGGALRLGWTSWLKTKPFDRDPKGAALLIQ